MHIITKWDSMGFAQKNQYINHLKNPPDECPDFIPPSSHNIDQVLNQRKEYLQSAINREQLADHLLQSHQQRHAPQSTVKAIEFIHNENCFFIITGQQPGLLGGPLLVFYKILHAIHLARNLSQAHNIPILPVFWNASEDHDPNEINQIHWISKDKNLTPFEWPLPTEPSQPYFTIPISQCPLDELMNQIKSSIQSTGHSDSVFNTIDACFQKAETYPDFFDQLMWTLFENDGLIIIRPEESFLREQSRAVIQREIENPLLASQSINQLSEKIESVGLTPQIHKRSDRTSFFLLHNNERLPLYTTEQGFKDQHGNVYPKKDLLDKAKHHSNLFSPSAILRPVIQDAVLPTVMSVLGPNELAYHFLLDGLYNIHNIPRPALAPRFGATLFEVRDMRLLDKYELSPHDLQQDANALSKKLLKSQRWEATSTSREQAEQTIEAYFQEIKEQAQTIDPTIIKVLDKNLNKIKKEINNSDDLLIRRENERNQVILNHIQNLQAHLLPNGTGQERIHNIFTYLIKYGFDFLHDLKSSTQSFQEGSHHYIQIP